MEKAIPPITIYCDSQATHACGTSKMYNGKSRRIDIRHNYIKQLVGDGVISVTYFKSIENLADPLTKGLACEMVYKTSKGMGLRSIK